MKQLLFFLLTVLTAFTGSSQRILSVNGKDIDVGQFKRMYEKSSQNPDYSPESVNKYLDLFIGYQLKLAEARAQGIDKDPGVRGEISVYEDKLLQNEIDKQLEKELVEEANNRLREEICAGYVFVPLERNPDPADTLKAYEKALQIRKEIKGEANFKTAIEKYSAEDTNRTESGDLGCFTALQLSSYDLETAIYQLKKGELSMPVRTRFGYHLVKVHDRRPSSGMAKATQLFIKAGENETGKHILQTAYNQLKNGEDFAKVADNLLQKGEDEGLLASKDTIDWFTVGSFESEFENAIFSLDNPGDYSKPVKTSLGWHLFRLEGKKELPPEEEMKATLREKIPSEQRYFQKQAAFNEDLKTKYNFRKNEQYVEQLSNQISENMATKAWEVSDSVDSSQILFSIGEQSVTGDDFITYVKEQHSLNHYHNFQQYYSTFERDYLLDAYKQEATKNNPELKSLLEEFRDGIVLFSLMERELWDDHQRDDQLMKAYYEQNKKKYPSAEEFSDVKSKVYMDYQKMKENKWIDQLRKKYPVSVNKEVLQSLYQ